MGKIYQPKIDLKQTQKYDEGDMVNFLNKVFNPYGRRTGADVPSEKELYDSAKSVEEQSIKMLNPILTNGKLPDKYSREELSDNIRSLQNKVVKYDDAMYADGYVDGRKWGDEELRTFISEANLQLNFMQKHEDRLLERDESLRGVKQILKEFSELDKGSFKDGYYNFSGDNQKASTMKLLEELQSKENYLKDSYTSQEIGSLQDEIDKTQSKGELHLLMNELKSKPGDIAWNEESGDYNVNPDWGPASNVYINHAMDLFEVGDLSGAKSQINNAVQAKATHLTGILTATTKAASNADSDIADMIEVEDEKVLKQMRTIDVHRPSSKPLAEGGNPGLSSALGPKVEGEFPLSGPYSDDFFPSLENTYSNSLVRGFEFIFSNTKWASDKYPSGFFTKDILEPENRHKFASFARWHLGEIDIVAKEDGGWEMKDVLNTYQVKGPDGKTFIMPMLPEEAKGAILYEDVQKIKSANRLGEYDYTDSDWGQMTGIDKFGWGEDQKLAHKSGIQAMTSLLQLHQVARKRALEKINQTDTWKLDAFRNKMKTVSHKEKKINLSPEDFDLDSDSTFVPVGDDTTKTKSKKTDVKESLGILSSMAMANRVRSFKKKWSRVSEGRGRLPSGTPSEINTESKWVMYKLLRETTKSMGFKMHDVDMYMEYLKEESKTNKDIIPFVSPDVYEQLKADVLKIIEDAKAE